jgi:hypothetical protein
LFSGYLKPSNVSPSTFSEKGTKEIVFPLSPVNSAFFSMENILSFSVTNFKFLNLKFKLYKL